MHCALVEAAMVERKKGTNEMIAITRKGGSDGKMKKRKEIQLNRYLW